MLKLHCFGESGNAYKAALALELSGLEWEPVAVDFFAGAARSDAYRAINPMREVPTLELPDGTRLSQSAVIGLWARDQTGRLGVAPEHGYEMLRWMFWDNHKLSSQNGVCRFLLHYLEPEKRAHQQSTIAFLQGRLDAAYELLDTHLADRDWIVGDALSLADISCCGYLFYPEPYGFVRGDWAHIDAWLERIAATPGWQHPYELMPPARPENRPSHPKET